MMLGYKLILHLLFMISAFGSNDNLSQFRGPNRDGIYTEKGLLKKWPDKGPELIWSFEGLGAGHGNVGIGRDKIFVLGMPDSKGIIYAFDFDGKLVWKKEYGPEFRESYPGSRATPTVLGELVYFESGNGVVFCYNGDTGKLLWSVDLLKKFDANNIMWGMTEAILIEGDRIFCTPGGQNNNVVALNRFTGETIWTSKGNQQPAAYCSPIFVRHNKTSLIVTITAASIIAVDAKTGQFYWQVEQQQGNKIHANSPVYNNGRIFCCTETGRPNSGLVCLKLSNDAKQVQVEWRNQVFSNLMGGMIVRDGFVYASKYQRNEWCCIDAATGTIKHNSKMMGDGVIIWADDLFYCYSEDGELGLVQADISTYRLISKFRIPLGTDQHWAHPVIHNGRLYIRHGNALMVYNIKKQT